jgi:hypothetical protein
MSAKKKSHPQKTPTSELILPSRNRWGLPLLIALILIPALGAWGYLKWMSAKMMREAAQITAAAEEPRVAAQPVAETTAGWNRPCEQGTCTWVTEDDQNKTWNEIDNAAGDGWDTEVFSSAATKQFDKLKKVLIHGPFEDNAVEFLVEPAGVVRHLLPPQLTTAFQDSKFTIQRAPLTDEGTIAADGEPRLGAAGLARSLRELLAAYPDTEKIRMKIKVFRVEKLAESVKTLQTVEIYGPTATGVREVNSIWQALWTAESEAPILKQLEPTQFESADLVGQPQFSECTESVLAQNESFRGQLLQGYNHWLDRSQFQRFFDLLGAPGVAIGDVNADGLEDMYVCQEGGLPNLLYAQQPDGTLRDVSRESGTDWLQNSRCALICDLNNDGHQDLLVGVDGGVVVAGGESNGKFAIQSVLDTSDDVLSLSAADYDQDGRLDLYVGVYYPNEYSGESETQTITTPGFIYYDAQNGGANSLFRNESSPTEWAFRDVTEGVGLNRDNARFTLAAAWDDMDNDGDQDLFVANDFGPKNVFRNDLLPDGTRQFVDVAPEANAKDNASGMSVAWGDYDRDGWMDVYVSNMFSYAGNRIMYQDQFKADAQNEIKDNFRRFARGNTLLRNLGRSGPANIQFADRSLEAAVNRGRWAWGSGFVDINNDGWEDIVVANGYVTTTEASGDL